MKPENARICLWSGPRNVSTALTYSFAQRTDTVVYDEPLYGFYLHHTDAQNYHPGAEEVLATMERNGEKVVSMMLGPQPRPVAFFKNMTHHLLDLDTSFLSQMKNILLTRDPMEMLPSFAKEIPNPSMRDVGYAAHSALLQRLDQLGHPPIIIDSKHLLQNPAGVLKTLCSRLGIPFDDSMLSWSKGARKEDGVWAKYWYQNVHQSTGFSPYRPKLTPFPENLKPLLEACQPHYEALSKRAIKA